MVWAEWPDDQKKNFFFCTATGWLAVSSLEDYSENF